ncbi:hypothetical protein BDV93DRAFT_558424 [Ceratobasidium sp. AG-I]|nr:hypothetical protein BDV93DRAFT_558424 [Ceratobasidium sp. AG-I]
MPPFIYPAYTTLAPVPGVLGSIYLCVQTLSRQLHVTNRRRLAAICAYIGAATASLPKLDW